MKLCKKYSLSSRPPVPFPTPICVISYFEISPRTFFSSAGLLVFQYNTVCSRKSPVSDITASFAPVLIPGSTASTFFVPKGADISRARRLSEKTLTDSKSALSLRIFLISFEIEGFISLL